jgi:alpha-D-ribose 1-methylphosphonate 5-triphosphate diphosphatase PhnM
MTEIDIQKRIKEAEFTRQHTISPEQFKKLIEDKMARARQYSEARCNKVVTRTTQHT